MQNTWMSGDFYSLICLLDFILLLLALGTMNQHFVLAEFIRVHL